MFPKVPNIFECATFGNIGPSPPCTIFGHRNYLYRRLCLCLELLQVPCCSITICKNSRHRHNNLRYIIFEQNHSKTRNRFIPKISAILTFYIYRSLAMLKIFLFHYKLAFLSTLINPEITLLHFYNRFHR